MSAQVQSIITTGTSGTIVDIECHLSNNLPTIVIVGFANKSVGESKERIRGAFATSRIMLPRKRITVNLAPADVPKADSGFDMAIAVAILLASQQIIMNFGKQHAFIGELGLDGSTRAVRGIIGKLVSGRAKGITTFYIPTANLKQAQLVPQIRLVAIDSLRQLFHHLTGVERIQPLRTEAGKYQIDPAEPTNLGIQLSEVVGQPIAKRALEIVAAGGHNIFFSGPPGTGKSMLAKALPGIMPNLSHEEILEITQLHSLASHDYEKLVTTRPFRSPHHSASHVAVTGGGANLRPGEISLAHRGILFFDELPEFQRDTLEALRQPLEDRVISIARAKDSVQYPANFIFIATSNPCPCGYAPTARCKCLPFDKIRYRHKLSGPILDRIDLYCAVDGVKHSELLTQTIDFEADNAVRQRILQARALQSKRFSTPGKLNKDMTNADIRKYACLGPVATIKLNEAARDLNISARSYMRVIKVARTIADLEASTIIGEAHLYEAFNFRSHAVKDNDKS